MSLANAAYEAEELSLTPEARDARRALEKERRAALEAHRDYKLVDADQHYYEPDDCFTRHLEQRYADQAIEVRRDESGTARNFVAGKPFRHLEQPVAENTSRPGSMRQYFKTQGRATNMSEEGLPASNIPEYVDRAARLRVLDAHDVQATLMLPTLGVVVETECKDMAPDAWYALMRSFNRWLEEDWGYGADGRIFGAPLVSLYDPDLAVVELERLLAAGAKVVLMRAGPVFGRSPADPIFDKFWARVEEANVPVAFHLGEHGYLDFFAPAWGYGNYSGPAGSGHPFEALTCATDRAAQDTVGALIFGNLFGRFPRLRCIFIELGASWVPNLLNKMDMIWRKPGRPGIRIDDEPSVVFKRNFWITPYYEDPWPQLIKILGPSQVVLGSDWPHPEGLSEPLDILEDIGDVTPVDLRMILRENTASLLGVR